MKRFTTIATVLSISLCCGMFYCYLNYQFWTHLKTDNFKALREYKGTNIIDLKGRQILVHKKFIPHMIKLDKYSEKHNITIVVNQSYRYDSKKQNGTIVRPSKMSNHHAGFAIDFNLIHNRIKYLSDDIKRGNLVNLPLDIQNFINDIRKDKGLRWGGDFKKEDPVHIDYPINLKSKRDWLIYNKLCRHDYSNGIPKWKFWL